MSTALMRHQKDGGFTIVELLIVIVVIGILAAIVIVAFNGVQNRANDAAVQRDLSNIGKKITAFNAMNDRWPKSATDLNAMGVKLSKRSYSQGFHNGTSWFNVVYCWPSTASPDTFAIVAASKSGAVYENRNGNVRKASYALGGSIPTCANAGVTLEDGGARDWFYENDAWQGYVKD